MAGPVLLAVEGDADTLRSIEQELRDRYGRHYRVGCLGSAWADSSVSTVVAAVAADATAAAEMN